MKTSRSNNRRTRSRYNIKLKTAREKDDEVVRIVEEMKKAEMKILRDKEWKIERELMFKEENLYIKKGEVKKRRS